MSLKKTTILVLVILLVDQMSKCYIKTHFELNEKLEVFRWFQIAFVENEGMAWGTKISDFVSSVSDRTAKVSLTIFRILAVLGIGYWLNKAIRDKNSSTLIFAVALVLAGALGNIIDSVFYGVIFDSSAGQLATFLPEQGYDTIFHGKVVDMLHFPMWSGILPSWIPFYGGTYFTFFDPVFNIADMAISTGIGILIIFNKRAFKDADNIKRKAMV